MPQTTTHAQVAPGSLGSEDENVRPRVDRKPAGFRPALAALLLATMVAPLGAGAADGQPAEGAATAPSARASAASGAGNGDAVIAGSGGTDSQADIQNSQGQGR